MVLSSAPPQHSHPCLFAFLSAAEQSVVLMQNPSFLQVSLQDLAAQRSLQGVTLVVSPMEESMAPNQGVLSLFLPASSFLCNCLGGSVSENHNEGKFEFEQTNRHTQIKNDLEKQPPNSFPLPHSEKWK